jgi:hypothetical protein
VADTEAACGRGGSPASENAPTGWNYHSTWTSGSKDRDLWTYGTQSEHNTELTAVQVELPEDI